MEIKKASGKDWDNWYDKQCKGEEREVKTALKKYEKRNDEDRGSKYYTCEKECVNHLDELRKDGRKYNKNRWITELNRKVKRKFTIQGINNFISNLKNNKQQDFMLYEMKHSGCFTGDNIIFINILKFIFLNSELKAYNSGMKVFRYSVILICI